MAEQNDRPIRGSGFNTDPQTGDWDQLAFENHNLNEYVRGENTDTDDAFAIYVQGVSTTTKVFNVLKTGAIWTGSQNLAGLSASVNITFAAAAAAGTGTAALRSDATLLLYDGTNPEPVGSVATTGSSSLAPRRDHVHAGVTSLAASGNSALLGAVRLYAGAGVGLSQIADGIQIMASAAAAVSATAGVPSLFFGTQNVAGSSGRYLDAASEILLYDGTMPSNISTSAAATGTATTAPRRDHTHLLTTATFNAAGAEPASDRQALGYQSVATISSVFTANFALGATVEAYLGASTAITFANMITGGFHALVIRYGGTFTPTLTDTIRWTAQTAPTYTAASGRYDMLSFYKHSDGTNLGTADLGH